jgi:hypothetical protein
MKKHSVLPAGFIPSPSKGRSGSKNRTAGSMRISRAITAKVSNVNPSKIEVIRM